MTVTTGWDLFEDLRAAQDEMLQAARGRNRQFGGGSPAAWSPPVDISERKDAYLVAVELPGVRPGLVDVTVEDGLLTIKGERHFAHDSAEETMHRTEHHHGPFRRSITLPGHIEADSIEAWAQDGVLHILVPKAPDVQAKRIQVHTGHGQPVPAQGETVSDAS
jgi:HSP20 family protein